MNFYGYDPNSYIGFPELSVSVSSVNNDEDIYLVPSEHISLINELIAPSVPAQMIVTVGLSSAVLGYLCVSGHKTLRVTCYCVYNEPHEQNDVSVKTEKKKIKRKKA